LLAAALDERCRKGQLTFGPELFAGEDAGDSITSQLEGANLLIRRTARSFLAARLLLIVRLIISLLRIIRLIARLFLYGLGRLFFCFIRRFFDRSF
jgi:hypothetical protein